MHESSTFHSMIPRLYRVLGLPLLVCMGTLAATERRPRLNFTEDTSRGDDPVYAFGTRLRQRQFTQADFALNALNRPQPIGNFSTRFSGSWTAFDSFKTQREIRRADLSRASASSSAKAVDQQIVLHVVEAYQSRSEER